MSRVKPSRIVLTTPVPVNAPVVAGDRVLVALQKLQGQINAKKSS